MVRFFNDYNAHFKELMDFEYKKLDMINNDRIEELSNILSTEQALIMRTDTLEKKRLELMEDNKERTFADIIAEAPVSCKARLEEQYKELAEYVGKIKELNDLANIIITGRLRRVEQKTAELNTYDDKGGIKTEYAAKASISQNV